MTSFLHTPCRAILALCLLVMGYTLPVAAQDTDKPHAPGAIEAAPKAVAANATAAAPVAATGSYMRVVDADEKTVRLDMAVRFFTPKEGKTGGGPTIALVAAIHIADARFYELAQHYLDAQDLVLFEGVGPGHEKGDATPAARIEQTREHLRTVAIMLERYKALKKEYPPSLSVLVKTVREHDALKGTRLERATRDAWGKALRYERSAPATTAPARGLQAPVPALPAPAATAAGFTLASLGADAKAGGEGENADLAFADQPPLKKAELEPSAGIQNDLAEALGLTFQLNKVDTGKPNYRNADMTVEQLQARMKETGGDMGAMLKMMDGSSMMAGVLKLGLGLIKNSPQMQATLKVLMSEMLRDMGDDISKIKGVPKSMQALMKTLIDDRNQTVIDELKKELEKPSAVSREPLAQDKQTPAAQNSEPKTQNPEPKTQNSERRTIAVWYGAGHMKDLEKRLMEQLNYQPAGGFWLPAISTDLSATGMSREEFTKLRASMQRMMGGLK